MHRLLVRTFTMPALLAILSLGCSEAHSKADVERTAGDSLHDASITMRIKTTYLFDGHLNPLDRSKRVRGDGHKLIVASVEV